MFVKLIVYTVTSGFVHDDLVSLDLVTRPSYMYYTFLLPTASCIQYTGIINSHMLFFRVYFSEYDYDYGK